MANEPMVGGDFLLATTSTISQSTMNALASMSGIPGFASYSSFTQITSLSTAQIASLISNLELLIDSEQSTIMRNQANITTLTTDINTPVTGYQARYTSTVAAYSAAVLFYNTQLQRQSNTQSTINSMNSTLSSMVVLDARDVSTIQGYQRQYSSIMNQMTYNSNILASHVSSYNNMSTTYGNYVDSYELLLAKTSTPNLPASTFLGISTQMAAYIKLEKQLEPYMQSTLNAISSLSFFSTTYQGDLNIYNSTYAIYSGLESGTLSTINTLLSQKGTLTTNISNYTAQLAGLNISSTNAFGALQIQSNTFYTQKLTQIQNQLLSFKLSVQEWRAFIGFLVAQLTIQYNNLNTNINLLNFQIAQITVSDPTTAARLTAQRSGYNTQQLTINGIISALNPLDNSATPSFQSILNICALEEAERDNFINNIRKPMTNIEMAVLNNPNSQMGYQSSYGQLFSNLGASAAQINTYMSNSAGGRWGGYNTLMSIIGPQLTAIRTLGTLAYSRPVQQTNPNTPFYLNPAEFQIVPFLTW
jgi:hypothetical protein